MNDFLGVWLFEIFCYCQKSNKYLILSGTHLLLNHTCSDSYTG
ncbi:unnamed protein product [Acanthoscelides obtectus]|uniref:Uncharacterized protein n=1 Tax=Acanthoscelides obtectus TaxID=200917 RepID=A0A9P0L015_ACAOB|nr:unnamed protein product [Acanthoscelides obtectus]CAK1620134.1 hypothetical protein AOBTE_LOCUS217 [Acanthoscelides obtectus]